MPELRFVRLSEDGGHLVLSDERGVPYLLPLDEALAAGVRRGLQRSTVRDTQPSITPRDIQALIRKGVSIEEVCDQTSLDEDFVRRFAEPVLAEMEFVIQRARRLSIFDDGLTISVEDLVERAARFADVPDEELQWSCRKVQEATWRIEASDLQGRPVAALVFRVNEGTISPADDRTTDLVRNPSGRVIDVTDGQITIPRHWDAEHPAAKAAARHASQPHVSDDPSRIF